MSTFAAILYCTRYQSPTEYLVNFKLATYRIYSTKHRPQINSVFLRSYINKRHPGINAASWGGVYSNDRFKKHTAINTLITVGNFVWTRHKSFWMYQFWCWGSISDSRNFFWDHFLKELRYQAQLGNQAFWWFVYNFILTSPDWLKCDWMGTWKGTFLLLAREKRNWKLSINPIFFSFSRERILPYLAALRSVQIRIFW